MKNRFEYNDKNNTYNIYFEKGKYFIIDAQDFKEVSEHSWTYGKRGYPVSTIRHFRGKKQSSWTLHKFILNISERCDIDHINGNKLDNRRCNLRVCTHQENSFNQRLRCTNTSGYYGVSFLKCAGKYEAYINLDANKIHLGLYEKAIDAAKARDRAAIKYFGEFARLNSDLKTELYE